MPKPDSLTGHWDQLRVFNVVANVCSVNKAASILNLHPSAVSRQIKHLEEALNTPLFTRHAKGLRLTNSGKALERSTHDIHHRVREVEAEIGIINRQDDSVRGGITLTATFGFGAFWIIPQIKDFLTENPNISMRLMLADSELSLDLNDVDVALRITKPRQDGLIMSTIGTYKNKIQASQAYLDQYGTPECVEDLINHRPIFFRGENVHLNRQIDWTYNFGIHHINFKYPPFVVSNMHGVLQAVNCGLGIGALPSYFPQNDNIHILRDLTMSDISVYFVCNRSTSKVHRIKALREFLFQRAQASLSQ